MSCENVLMSVMAEADGERAQLSPEEIQAHLDACENCRDEVVRMQRFIDILRQGTRAEGTVDLWPAVSNRLDRQASERRWHSFVVIGGLLVIYKLFEMLPAKDPGLAIKLVPLILFGVLLVVLRENPFRINSELVLEEWR